MKKAIVRGLVLPCLLCPCLIVRAAGVPPANDKFVNATVLSGNVATVVNQTCAGATAEPFDPDIAGVRLTRSVWYRFDPQWSTTNSHLIITHFNGAARLGVYELLEPDGGEGSLLKLTDINAPAAGTDTLTFSQSGNMRYYICAEVPTGAFSLTLQQPGQPNDFFADAQALVGDSGMIDTTNLHCSDTGDNPAIAPSLPLRVYGGIWYTWKPGFTGQAAITTNFSYLAGSTPHYTNLNVFTGTTLGNLVLLKQDSISGLGFANSRVSFPVTAGTKYTIWVGDLFSGQSGPIHLEWFNETSAGQFELVTPGSTVVPGQGAVPVQVRRHFAGSVAASVTVATSSGTAIAGTDYLAVPATVLMFPAATGVTPPQAAYVANVAISALANPAASSERNFLLLLGSPSAGASISTGNLSFFVTDFLAVTPGFTTPAVTVREADGIVYLPIQRFNSLGQVSFEVLANPHQTDTARLFTDYSLSYSSSFGPGQTQGFIGVTIYNNTKAEGNRTLTLTINPRTAGQAVDGSDTVTVTILDDEAPAPVASRISTILFSQGAGLGATVDAKITATGALTGKLVTDRGTYAFTGKLNAAGFYSVTVGPAGATRTLTVQLLSSTQLTYQLGLYANDLPLANSAIVTATTYSAQAPCPLAGSFTLADGAPGTPPAYTTASVKVDALGNATVTGKVFDGTAYIATGSVDTTLLLTAGATLYGGQGGVRLRCVLPLVPALPNRGSMELLRPDRAGQAVEFAPLVAAPDVQMVQYAPPSAGLRILPQWDGSAGIATLAGAGYTGMPTQNFTVSAANKVTLATATLGGNPPPNLKLTLLPATGLFTGTLTPPGTIKPQNLCGAFFQLGASSSGAGLFLNPATPVAVGAISLK